MYNRQHHTPTRSLALLALVALFAAVIVGLPLGHQLFHDSLVEPEHCSVCLLQAGLALLGSACALALLALTSGQSTPALARTVPLPLFSPRFTCPNRAPPRR